MDYLWCVPKITHLQDDPMSLLGCDLDGLLCHLLLPLAQRHVVQTPVLAGVAQAVPETLDVLRKFGASLREGEGEGKRRGREGKKELEELKTQMER